jgi:GWxTD domain-containing protein
VFKIFTIVLSVVSVFVFNNLNAALLFPATGGGDFIYTLDIVSSAGDDNLLDLDFIFSIPNREINFTETEDGSFDGRVGVSIHLLSNELEVANKHINIKTATNNAGELISQTLQQVFSINLNAVKPGDYEVITVIRDLNREVSSKDESSPWAQSTSSINLLLGFESEGLVLSDPTFLCGMAMNYFDCHNHDISAFYHPNRCYGAEEKFLQVRFSAKGIIEEVDNYVLIQISDSAQFVAFRDTIVIDSIISKDLHLGRTIDLNYELDISKFKSGEYLLSCAAMSGNGNCWVTVFSVDYSMPTENLPADVLESVGRLLFPDTELVDFLEGNYSKRLSEVKSFWNNSVPEKPGSGSHLLKEFERRINYVVKRYGGFTRFGPEEDRGLVYLLLGEPDELQQQVVPLNGDDFEDAVSRVFDPWTPERHGSSAKDGFGIPIIKSSEVQAELRQRVNSFGFENAHELWLYDSGGWQLSPNQFSGNSMGLRFLFVDRSGTGMYSLELTNAWKSSIGGMN